MAYNNYFPTGYQPYYPTQNNAYPTNQPTHTNGIIWVQGEAGAKSYLVAPNNTVQLWDSESQTIFLKSADASGMPSMKVLDYTIREAAQPTPQVVNAPDYVTRDELTAFENQIREQIASITPKRTTKKEEKTDG